MRAIALGLIVAGVQATAEAVDDTNSKETRKEVLLSSLIMI